RCVVRTVGKTVGIDGGLIVDGADTRSRQRRSIARALQNALVEQGERVLEMSGKLIGRWEDTAEAEGVLQAGGLDADVEEGSVLAGINLGDPDRAADIEAIVVFVQCAGDRAAVGKGVE